MTPRVLAPALLLLVVGATAVAAGPLHDALAKSYATAAGGASADRGRAFFAATHVGGKPDTPSCATCHGVDPTKAGKTRAGKVIEPMAVSTNPKRFTDPAEVEKWFARNCDSVLGRACTATEKADVVAHLTSR